MSLPPYLILNKNVGQTPLEVLENWRHGTPEASGVPLAYAGRLDPMANGQLLMLIGEECKVQTKYHHLDKEYRITLALGLNSDSGDVLGITKEEKRIPISEDELKKTILSLIGEMHVPYPVFSSKTVNGKPLHTWAVEGRLNEIEVPTRTSSLYEITLDKLYETSRAKITQLATDKIALLPKVTDPRKALGNDFRRGDVLQSWDEINHTGLGDDIFYLADLTVTCSSGTYMRTLCEVIGEKLETTGLALAICRTKIGHYDPKDSTWAKVY